MRKDAAEGSKLYYAQVRSLKKLKFEKFCNMVAVHSSAFVGDVKLVIDGILSVMEERLEEGDVIQLGRLGNFRMVAGSKGVENEADFNTSFFNKARIVFSPGTMLTQVKKNVTFEHLDLVPAGVGDRAISHASTTTFSVSPPTARKTSGGKAKVSSWAPTPSVSVSTTLRRIPSWTTPA